MKRLQTIEQRRAHERVSADIGIRFACGSIFYTGTITDLSEKGMFIRAKACFPVRSMFAVIVLAENQLLQLFVTVRRIAKENGLNQGMGVEIMNPSNAYFEFVHSNMYQN